MAAQDNPATIAPDERAQTIPIDMPYTGAAFYGYEGTRGESLNGAFFEGVQSARY